MAANSLRPSPRSRSPREPLSRPSLLYAAWVPVVGVVLTILGILRFGLHDPLGEPPWLLPTLNIVVFVTISGLGVGLAGRGFLESGSVTLLLLGDGLLSFGLATVAGSILVAGGDTNAGVAAHNTIALLSAGLHVLGAGLAWQSLAVRRRRRHTLTLTHLLTSLAIVGLVVGATEGLLPPFIAAGHSTLVREVVIAATSLLYLVASVLFALRGRRTGAAFLGWYAYGLALVGIGVAAVALGPVGSPIGWTGRIAQILGQVYVFGCLLSALVTLPSSKARASAILGRSFRRMEEALALSEARYSDLFGSLLDGFALHRVVTDADGVPVDYVFVQVNDAFQEMLGRSAEEIVGRRVTEVFPGIDNDPGNWIERYGAIALDGTPLRFDQYSETLDKWFTVSAYSPERGYFVTVFDDITERKLAEARRDEYVTQLLRLLEVSTDVLSATERDEMLQVVTSSARDLIGADAAVSGHQFREGAFSAHVSSLSDEDAPEPTEQAAWAIATTLASSAWEGGLRLTTFDLNGDERWASAIAADPQLSNVLAARFRTRDGTTAGVVVLARKDAKEFSDEDGLLLRHLASIASLGLEQLKAYQRERNIADTLQQAILAPPEEIEGLEVSYLYRPASKAANIGGDFYDVFRLSEQTVGILIGDVSGKGLEAARLTSLVRDGVRAYAYETPEPGFVVTHLNMLLNRASPVDVFVTLFFGILDLKTGAMAYCSAGHVPGIVMRGDHSLARLEVASGLVGAFPHLAFKTQQVRLAPGEKLVLYTDGVTEARRGPEFFGEERLFDALARSEGSAQELPEQLLDAVLDFSEGRLRDDTVILCLSRTPSDLTLAG